MLAAGTPPGDHRGYGVRPLLVGLPPPLALTFAKSKNRKLCPASWGHPAPLSWLHTGPLAWATFSSLWFVSFYSNHFNRF